MHYTPHIDLAFYVEHITRVNNGWFIRYLHANEHLCFSLWFISILHVDYIIVHLLPPTLSLNFRSYNFSNDGYSIYCLCITLRTNEFLRATVITSLFGVCSCVRRNDRTMIMRRFFCDNATLNRFLVYIIYYHL